MIVVFCYKKNNACGGDLSAKLFIYSNTLYSTLTKKRSHKKEIRDKIKKE
jgi:hypothetical protein